MSLILYMSDLRINKTDVYTQQAVAQKFLCKYKALVSGSWAELRIGKMKGGGGGWSWVCHWTGERSMEENNGQGVVKAFLLKRFHRGIFTMVFKGGIQRTWSYFMRKSACSRSTSSPCNDLINQWGQVFVHFLQLGWVTEECSIFSRFFWIHHDSSDIFFS